MGLTIWESKPWNAFKNFAVIFSFAMNLTLLIILLAAAPILLPALNSVAKPLVGGLTDSFVQMGEANIVQTIQVEDEIPVVFSLPLETDTKVQITEGVPLDVPATFVLPGGGGVINGEVSLVLPAGTDLPVRLSLNVPVDQQVPVNLAVDVDIPLDQTELGVPFQNLQELFIPLDRLVDSLPASNGELFDRIQGGSAANDALAPPQAASE